MRLLRWFFSQTAGFYLNLFALWLIVGAVSAAQVTSYDVTSNPQMRLSANIGPSQVTGIKIAPLKKNGQTVIFPNQTGGVLRIRSGDFFEDLSFTGATVNSTTKEVTLLGVTRDICWNQANTLTACGNGRQWYNGDIIELNVHHFLLNQKADVDRMNTFVNSGGILCSSSSQPCFFTLGVSTAIRDAFSFGTSAGYYPEIFNTTLGVRQYWNGSSWVSYGSGSTVNASDTVRGAVQLISAAHLVNRTQTGATNALNVLTPRWLTKIGSGSTSAFLIPQLTSNGVLAASLGGTGIRNPSSGSVVVASGSGAFKEIAPGTNKNVLQSNGTVWYSGASPGGTLTYSSGAYATKLAANSGEQNHSRIYTFSANELVAGSLYQFTIMGTGSVAAASTITHKLKLGNTTPCAHTTPVFPGTSTYGWSTTGFVNVQSTGASGKVHVTCTSNLGQYSGGSGATMTVDTTGTLALQPVYGINSNNGYEYLTEFLLFKVR